MAKKGAKPVVTEVRGYNRNGKQIEQIKIATSNLFIDTGTVPVDYMTGAVFDGIGGNEFINGGSSDIILKEGNSLISNASGVLYDINTKTNEKQADGTDGIFSKFAISLNSYLPTKLDYGTEFIAFYYGNYTDPTVDPFLEEAIPARNIYFDETYENIYIELNNLPEDEEVEVEFIVSSSGEGGII